MKYKVLSTQPIEVTFRDGSKRVFADKQEIVNHFTNKTKSVENCIAHYEKELVRLKAELTPLQEDLALSDTIFTWEDQ